MADRPQRHQGVSRARHHGSRRRRGFAVTAVIARSAATKQSILWTMDYFASLAMTEGVLGVLTLRLLPRHRLPADVAAAKAFRPTDTVDRLIGAILRLRHRLAERADIQHPPAVGDDAAVLRCRAGVKNLDAIDLGSLVEAADDGALAVVAGIAFGRHDHRQRGIVEPAQAEIPELPVGAGDQRRHDVRHHPQYQHLAFGIAEARVVFDQLWAILRHHDAGKDHALVG